MKSDRLIRVALCLSVVANFAVAALLLDPASAPAQLAGMPLPAPHPVYRALLAAFVALFGGAYAWVALQAVINREFVLFAALGKFLAFAVTVALWMGGESPGRWTLLMSGDLLFAAIFTGWWLRTRNPAAVAAP